METKTLEQTFIDIQLADLHIKPIEKWTNEDWHFFAKNKDRVLQLVKSGYMDGIIK